MLLLIKLIVVVLVIKSLASLLKVFNLLLFVIIFVLVRLEIFPFFMSVLLELKSCANKSFIGVWLFVSLSRRILSGIW